MVKYTVASVFVTTDGARVSYLAYLPAYGRHFVKNMFDSAVLWWDTLEQAQSMIMNAEGESVISWALEDEKEIVTTKEFPFGKCPICGTELNSEDIDCGICAHCGEDISKYPYTIMENF